MANENHARAFIFGALLGGAAAAAYAIWNAPSSGAALRAGIADGLEGTVFRLMRMDEARDETPIEPVATASSPIADRPATDDGGTDIVIDGPRPIEITS